jgi:YidC/Oxa1 family membrane protein insertase
MNNGLSIIGVSLAVTFICLPLYIVAEKWQKTERDTIKRLKPKVDKIKAVFKGDEQYMILSTYYRQNHYHPLYSLRGSTSILIQVPFFIAAYTFLSHLEALKVSSFYFIRDLGAPDGLLSRGKLRLNLLPVLMTLINCVSGAIYTNKLLLRDKIQVYGMALIFLLLLYNSPAGLVFYWTMNNIFSLIKNIFQLIKKPLKVLYILSCIAVLFLVVYLLFFHHGNLSKRLIMIGITLIIPVIPLILKLFNRLLDTSLKTFNADNQNKTKLFIVALFIICLLTGFLIPSFVINSSPQEFSYIDSVNSPFVFLFNAFFQSLGLFVFWPLCIYFLFGNKVKTFLTFFFVFIGLASIINTFCFSGSYGELSSMLAFSNAGLIKPESFTALINIFIMLLTVFVIYFLLSYDKLKLLFSLSLIVFFSLFCVSAANSVGIAKEYGRYTAIRGSSAELEVSSLSPIFNFSREGKNILIVVFDRGLNFFVPEIFSESPQLYEQYSGFIYYPNTISYNSFTIMGMPPVFGGYEYTPREINKRDSIPLVKKHNEALLLMPVIFSGNDFAVTVTDPPWANYSWIPDGRIYSDYPDITIRNTIRPFTGIWLDKNNFSDLQLKSKILKRNFLLFSVFKTSPLLLREAVYNNGEWWSTDNAAVDLSLLINNYAVLDFLPELTGTQALKQNTFTIFSNELPHEPAFLQAPDYVPSLNITNRGTSKYADNMYYHVNAASLKLLGVWFEHLKQTGVYDNTRIIISSDHGANINTGIFTESEKLGFNREYFNPILMFKDFNSDFPLITDFTFMTNADVPTLAFTGIIENPVNPFTGNPVNDSIKQNPQHITTSSKWMPNEHNTNTFRIGGDEWYTVHSDIFKADNWERAEN